MSLSRDLNSFFFGSRHAAPLGLFRILFGLIILSWCLLLIPDLKTWFGEAGMLPLTGMYVWAGNPLGLNLLAHVTNFNITVAAFALLMLSSIFVTIGFQSRISSIVMWVMLVTFHHRDLLILNGGDTLQRNMAFLLMFADSGAACSVDRLLRIAKGKERADEAPMVEAWPQRLIQMQIAAVYISAVASKLQGPDWQDGTAFYYAIHLSDMRRFPTFGLTNQFWFYTAATYFTLLAEFCLGTAIWIRKLRPYVLTLGVALHGGIEYMMNVPLYSYMMIASYMNFVPNEWLESFKVWLPRRLQKSHRLEVPYSGRMSEPARNLLSAVDSFSLIRIIQEEGRHATPLLVRRAIWRLPVTWAVTLTPPMLVTVILPVRWLILPFGLMWPLAAVWITFLAASKLSFMSRGSTGAPNSGARDAVPTDLAGAI